MGGELIIDKGLSSHRTSPIIIPLPTTTLIVGVSSRENGKAKEVITSFSKMLMLSLFAV